MRRVSTDLRDADAERLRDEAQARIVPRSVLIREIIKEWLANREGADA